MALTNNLCVAKLDVVCDAKCSFRAMGRALISIRPQAGGLSHEVTVDSPLRCGTLRPLTIRFPRGRRARSLRFLINPFYPKDPHASYGKHVLTPSLALTSIAGATPPDWDVDYWDENLLQGPPPWEPFPQVVGITVHLTFAERAYALAAWYRERGAKVILGGLHVLSCPDEAAPHADALAIGEGVQVWPDILRDVEAGHTQGGLSGKLPAALPRRPAATSRRASAPRLPHDHEPDRNARLP